MQHELPANPMNTRAILGKKGEDLALQYLQKKGYTLLERNWRFRHKEVDIIATDGRDLVFVEVKTRSSDWFGAPEEAVDDRKQRYLMDAAEAFIRIRKLDTNIRFDVVSIILKPGYQSIDHIMDAF
jgi:putative endonuclease